MVELMRELKKAEAGSPPAGSPRPPWPSSWPWWSKGAISGKLAKTVFEDMVATGKDPEAIVKEKGLAQISDTGALESLTQEIINANPKEAADYRAGKTKVMGFFVGQLMKQTRGQANPQLANEIFQKLLR